MELGDRLSLDVVGDGDGRAIQRDGKLTLKEDREGESVLTWRRKVLAGL